VNDGIEGGGVVDLDAGAGSAAASVERDVDVSGLPAEAPDRRGRLVAQRAARGEHGRHLGLEPRARRSHAVDAVVQPDEPARVNGSRDEAPPNPRIETLGGRHDAVLPGGEGQDGVHFCNLGAVRRCRLQKRTYRARFCNIGGRAAEEVAEMHRQEA
jgi:hypothetical protein